MRAGLLALLAGSLFGFGLCLSAMVNPRRVIGFLDVTGVWDPTLVFVMLGAVALTALLFPLILRRKQPILSASFHLPQRSAIDLPLVLGAVLFGAGWGVAGLCPGPAITALASLTPEVGLFVIAMAAGQGIGIIIEKKYF